MWELNIVDSKSNLDRGRRQWSHATVHPYGRGSIWVIVVSLPKVRDDPPVTAAQIYLQPLYGV